MVSNFLIRMHDMQEFVGVHLHKLAVSTTERQKGWCKSVEFRGRRGGGGRHSVACFVEGFGSLPENAV